MSLQAVVQKIADRRAVPKPPPPAVTDAQLALQVDAAWKDQVRKTISEFVREARRESCVQRAENLATRIRAWTWMSAARRLKGLLR